MTKGIEIKTEETIQGFTFKVLNVTQDRPKEVWTTSLSRPGPKLLQDHWLIFNAFRPIAGTIDDSWGSVRWQDMGPHGIHWAAINPNDSMAKVWLKNNHRDNAVLINFVDAKD